MTLHIVLVEPEIPPNTGSIARLTAGAKVPLHLVEPLGFSLEDKYLKRAGLDYWPAVDLYVHPDFDDLLRALPPESHPYWFFSKKTKRPYTDVQFTDRDVLVFGKETKGLSEAIRSRWADRLLSIPIWGEIRSYNLANAVSIALFEALRQTRPFDL